MKFKLITENILDNIEFNSKDKNYLGELSDNIANDIYNLISDILIDDNDINEQFVSKSAAKMHYIHHCIGRFNNKSSRQKIFYDFTNLSDYVNYENKINNKCKNADIIISSLYDTKLVLDGFRKLFEGGKTIEFTKSCNFSNSNGNVIICLNSFASDVTTNYLEGNTINLCILSSTFKTISMYAVDANYLENKFNSIISKYNSDKRLKFYFNR